MVAVCEYHDGLGNWRVAGLAGYSSTPKLEFSTLLNGLSFLGIRSYAVVAVHLQLPLSVDFIDWTSGRALSLSLASQGD